MPVPVIDTDQRREPVCICHRAAPYPLITKVAAAVRRDAIPRHIKPELVTLRKRQTLLKRAATIAALPPQRWASFTLLAIPAAPFAVRQPDGRGERYFPSAPSRLMR